MIQEIKLEDIDSMEWEYTLSYNKDGSNYKTYKNVKDEVVSVLVKKDLQFHRFHRFLKSNGTPFNIINN